MSEPRPPQKAILVISSIYSERTIWETCMQRLTPMFGDMDYQSAENSFSHTDYYCREMGSPLSRQFISFKRLMDPGDLVDIKLFTNTLEKDTSSNGKRRVNLDPGMLGMGQLVLATGKPSPHRIYLGRGIYADLTLIFESGGFRPLPWTYPDYSSAGIISMLNGLRETLKAALREGKK